jgi:hypothetical protein
LEPSPPSPPTAPMAPTAPRPPKAPKVPKAGGSGVSVQIDGLDEIINAQIDQALESVAHDPHIPDAVRAKITKRLEKVKQKVHAKAASGKLDPDDLEDLGEEIGEEMEEFGKEMEKWGENFSKQMRKTGSSIDVTVNGQRVQVNGGKVSVNGQVLADDDDDDDDEGDDDDDDADLDIDLDDDDDISDAMTDMGDLKLAPAQRDQIKKLRLDSDAKVAAAKRDLNRASGQLQKQLENPATSEADIARSIDAVTQQEAAIRKARILAWHNARRILDDSQRKKVEGAAKHKTK